MADGNFFSRPRLAASRRMPESARCLSDGADCFLQITWLYPEKHGDWLSVDGWHEILVLRQFTEEARWVTQVPHTQESHRLDLL
jgi:hypothetical protein